MRYQQTTEVEIMNIREKQDAEGEKFLAKYREETKRENQEQQVAQLMELSPIELAYLAINFYHPDDLKETENPEQMVHQLIDKCEQDGRSEQLIIECEKLRLLTRMIRGQ
jgi:myo-inositol catabolism protein IolC